MKTEPAGVTQTEPCLLPVDGHVHFHSVARVETTLDAAAANFCAQAGRASGCVGVLLLTQAAGEHVFEDIRDRAACGHWQVQAMPDESQSLSVQRGELSMVVICGRQIRCKSGLELTALGTTLQYADGQPLADSVREVQASGALACLPWGFGKWLGARGEVIRRVLLDGSPLSLAVCDNGSRLQALGEPALIREARGLGYKVLPGTDPFPFGDDHRRVGAFGFLAAAPGPSAPWCDLHAWLQSRESTPPVYGKALGPVRFLVNNIGIQVRNRLRRS